MHLLVPVDTAHNRLVEALDEAAMLRLRDAMHDSGDRSPEQAEVIARGALEMSLSALRAAGLEADGELAPDDPVRATVEAAARLDADEIIVLTRPHPVEDALRRDWASKLRDRSPKPVLHAIAGTDWVV